MGTDHLHRLRTQEPSYSMPQHKYSLPSLSELDLPSQSSAPASDPIATTLPAGRKGAGSSPREAAPLTPPSTSHRYSPPPATPHMRTAWAAVNHSASENSTQEFRIDNILNREQPAIPSRSTPVQGPSAISQSGGPDRTASSQRPTSQQTPPNSASSQQATISSLLCSAPSSTPCVNIRPTTPPPSASSVVLAPQEGELGGQPSSSYPTPLSPAHSSRASAQSRMRFSTGTMRSLVRSRSAERMPPPSSPPHQANGRAERPVGAAAALFQIGTDQRLSGSTSGTDGNGDAAVSGLGSQSTDTNQTFSSVSINEEAKPTPAAQCSRCHLEETRRIEDILKTLQRAADTTVTSGTLIDDNLSSNTLSAQNRLFEALEGSFRESRSLKEQCPECLRDPDATVAERTKVYFMNRPTTQVSDLPRRTIKRKSPSSPGSSDTGASHKVRKLTPDEESLQLPTPSERIITDAFSQLLNPRGVVEEINSSGMLRRTLEALGLLTRRDDGVPATNTEFPNPAT